MSAEPAVVTFFRVDQTGRIRRVLVVGASLITFGAIVMAASFLTRNSEDVRKAAALFGFASTIAGGLTAAVGMSRALREDACLVVRTDGLVMQSGARETLLSWSEIARVSFDASDRVIVVERIDGTKVVVGDRPFAGRESKALAGELDGMRRKAAWNLLRD